VLTGGLLCSTRGFSSAPWFAVSPPSSLAPAGVLEGDGGGVFTSGLLISTGSASCPLRVVPFSLSLDRAPLAGFFALSSLCMGAEVTVAEAECLVLGAAGALPLIEVAFPASPIPLSAA